MVSNKEIGARVREARLDAGMTRKELAQKIYIGYSTLSRYEEGAFTMRVDTLCDIADVLGVTANWLLFGDKEENDGKQ